MKIANQRMDFPNREKRILLAKTFVCTRFVYNHYLAKRRDAYEKDGITLNYSACAKDLEYYWPRLLSVLVLYITITWQNVGMPMKKMESL